MPVKLADEPLPSIEGCGLNSYRLGSLRSDDAAPATLPFPRDAAQSRSADDPGREEDEGGCPSGELRNTSHHTCCGSFSRTSTTSESAGGRRKQEGGNDEEEERREMMRRRAETHSVCNEANHDISWFVFVFCPLTEPPPLISNGRYRCRTSIAPNAQRQCIARSMMTARHNDHDHNHYLNNDDDEPYQPHTASTTTTIRTR